MQTSRGTKEIISHYPLCSGMRTVNRKGRFLPFRPDGNSPSARHLRNRPKCEIHFRTISNAHRPTLLFYFIFRYADKYNTDPANKEDPIFRTPILRWRLLMLWPYGFISYSSLLGKRKEVTGATSCLFHFSHKETSKAVSLFTI